MTIKRRIEKLETQKAMIGADEPLVITWADGQVIGTLDPAGMGMTWADVFESIAKGGKTINDPEAA